MNLKESLYTEISFPDYQITSLVFNEINKEMFINIDGIYVSDFITDGSKKCILFIFNWDKFEILEYISEQHKYITITNEFDELEDICESIINKRHLVLKGFGKTKGWIEYHFYNTNIKIKIF